MLACCRLVGVISICFGSDDSKAKKVSMSWPSKLILASGKCPIYFSWSMTYCPTDF